jgi:hypothetical protein
MNSRYFLRARLLFSENIPEHLVFGHECQGIILPGVCMMAAPGVGIECLGNSGPEWVLVNVFQQTEQVCFPVAQNSLIAALKKMTDGPVLVIEIQGIALVDTLKNFGKRCIAGLDQEMDVVAHEHIGSQMIMIPVPINEEKLEKFVVVGGFFEDLLALVPPRDHVVESAFKLNAGLPWHEGRLSREGVECQF